jgi:L-fuculose-phosphate aldolase
MTSIEYELRQELIEFSNRMALSGLIRGSSGNASARLDEQRILITPTQLPKGYLRERDIVMIDTDGNLIEGNHPPSMDTEFHLAAYRARPDAQAVIHAHPIITTAFSLVGKTIGKGTLPEFDFLFPKGVPIVPYQSQLSQELPATCGDFIAEYDIVILSHHGTLAVGKSLMMAWMLTEHLETYYEVVFYAECLASATPMPEDQVNLLREVHKRKKFRSGK